MKTAVKIANLFIFFLIGSILCGLTYILLHLKDLKPDFSLTAGILSILFLVGLVALLKSAENIRVNLCLSLFVSILAIEIFESTLPIDPIIKVKPFSSFFVSGKFPKLADNRSRLRVVEDLREKGLKAFPNISPSYFMLYEPLPESFRIDGKPAFPLTGISNATTVQNRESGEWEIYESDEHGFNNPKGLYKTNQLDMILIGDSFVQGSGVLQHESIGGVIRETIPNTLAFGVFNIGPLYELAIFREYVEPLKPKKVIWFYYEGNDIDNLSKESPLPELIVYLTNPNYTQHLIDHQDHLDAMLTDWELKKEIKEKTEKKKEKVKFNAHAWYVRIKMTLLLSRLRTLSGIQFSNKNYQIPCPPHCHLLPKPPPHWAFHDILKLVKEKVASWGGELYVVSIPSADIIREGVMNRKFVYAEHRDPQLTLVDELNIPLIELYHYLVSHPKPMSLYPKGLGILGHFNKNGYRFIAEKILENTQNTAQ